MRKQNKPTVVNAIDEINLTDERWWAIIQWGILLRSKNNKTYLSFIL
ncbi:hypothetical protein P3L23_00910 [Bacillus cereus]|nr:hypothetical protein [Bacillus cereus]MDH7998030.1 hypothetical protein [Bacillus cereus]